MKAIFAEIVTIVIMILVLVVIWYSLIYKPMNNYRSYAETHATIKVTGYATGVKGVYGSLTDYIVRVNINGENKVYHTNENLWGKLEKDKTYKVVLQDNYIIDILPQEN